MAQQRLVELQQVMSRSACMHMDDGMKLSKESGNYQFWKMNVMNTVRSYACGLPEYLEADLVVVPEGDEAYLPSVRIAMDYIVTNILQRSLSMSLWNRVMMEGMTGRTAWVYVETLCNSLSELDVYKLGKNLIEMERGVGETPADFFNRLNIAWMNLSHFIGPNGLIPLLIATKAKLPDDKAVEMVARWREKYAKP